VIVEPTVSIFKIYPENSWFLRNVCNFLPECMEACLTVFFTHTVYLHFLERCTVSTSGESPNFATSELVLGTVQRLNSYYERDFPTTECIWDFGGEARRKEATRKTSKQMVG
jgi:hypothetical protein